MNIERLVRVEDDGAGPSLRKMDSLIISNCTTNPNKWSLSYVAAAKIHDSCYNTDTNPNHTDSVNSNRSTLYKPGASFIHCVSKNFIPFPAVRKF